MTFEIKELDCNIYGRFKNGDNAVYNAGLLSDLVKANDEGQFNKLVTLQCAALIEVAAFQIFYRAKNYNNEGVPNIDEKDRQKIAGKQIDNFAVIIDNLRKYGILDGLRANIYDELHALRKYRNKIHIQLDVGIEGVSRNEAEQFTIDQTKWAIDLNWAVHEHLNQKYPRPKEIEGFVKPLRLPKST